MRQTLVKQTVAAESGFLFEIDAGPASDRVTSFDGAAVPFRALRSLGVARSVAQHVHLKKRVAVTAMRRLWLGDALPSPEAARNSRYELHDESRIDAAKRQCGLLARKAYIPGENVSIPVENFPFYRS